MPPPPKFRYGGGGIGTSKVFREMEAQHPAHADSHIGVAGKIKVNLKAIGRDTQPAAESCQHPGGLRRQLCVPQGTDAVGQQDLFRKAYRKAARTGGKVRRGVHPLLQLRRHLPIADDRPRHQLREHGDVSPEGHNIPLGGRVLPVDINGIAHGLKGKKGNADGQGQSQRRKRDSRQT